MNQPRISAHWSFPCPVMFGPGSIRKIAATIQELGSKSPLIVTDQGLADHPMCSAIINYLSYAGIKPALFSGVQPNPTGENVSEGVAAFKSGSHDAVVALGGGSAIDAAKAVALMAGQTISMWDLEDIGDNWRRADTHAIAPVVAIPTTAGTGSEFGRSSVISNAGEKRKVIIFHPEMLPDFVIMDPELTVGLPPVLTAGTGIDALSHALEAWCAPSFHPMADGLAVQAMVMIRDALPAVHDRPDDIDQRGQMLIASGMACLALQKGLGAMHAISHPIGALHDAHHGILNGILMPHVLRANWDAIEPRMALLSSRMGLGGRSQDILDFVNSLIVKLDLPTSLETIGVEIEDPKGMAKMALADPCAQGNPVELTTETVLQILDAARADTRSGKPLK